ncbi:MAG: hypothetical protein RL297_1700 [Pseudomonadota bacterium]|jgi:uncharacterized protein (DUF1800 family)
MRRNFCATLLCLLIVGCGGGGADTGSNPEPSSLPTVEKPATRQEAMRFLTQATFGPVEADIKRVMTIGYSAWIDEQFALPAFSHLAYWDARDAGIRGVDGKSPNFWGHEHPVESFWKQAVTGSDQLRHRVTFALSQIFVISLLDSGVSGVSRGAAAWLDMLGRDGLGNYRVLLESVSRNPMMGMYLSHIRNQKADLATGRVPDENFAREVMQLFSIGLLELNEDGTPRTSGGVPIETYNAADVAGMAKVFTGWSWACPTWPNITEETRLCFLAGNDSGRAGADRGINLMRGFSQFHSTEDKYFLGTTIPAQAQADPDASLRVALDTLANHRNTGPFIGKQLIQRLVTSNPSPAYVRDVARVFANNGQGVRGDMKAVIKAVLMHTEARTQSDISGKVREPVLRLSAFLRAFGATSSSGYFKVGYTSDPGSSLGQMPLYAPSVFNFYRPGYVAPGTASAKRKLLAPELQIANETAAAGYVNYMRDAVALGVGPQRDVKPDYSAELILADDPTALVDHVLSKLTYGSVGDALRKDIIDTVSRFPIPAATGNNQAAVNTAKRTRVNIAVLLALASPEFAVQR